MLSFTDTTLAGELEHRQPLLGRGGKISPLQICRHHPKQESVSPAMWQAEWKIKSLHGSTDITKWWGREGAIGALLRDFIR